MQTNLYQISSLIKHICKQIQPVYPHESIAQQDAWLILSFITKKSKTTLIAEQSIILNKKEQTILENVIDSIVNEHKPISYIIGSTPFLNLTIATKPPLLIPRPETEMWCDKLITHLINKNFESKKGSILDLCTGSGCIGIALAKTFPKSLITAIDCAPEACALARENARKNLQNQNNISIIQSDLFSEFKPNTFFDLIVANPPYINQEDYEFLDPSVKKWEAKEALYADENGLACIKKIILNAPRYLAPSSSIRELWIEIGHEQAESVTNLFKMNGFIDIIIHQDFAGKNRVISGTQKSHIAKFV